jgi:2-alkenal reductase
MPLRKHFCSGAPDNFANSFRGASVAQGAASGFIWDKAGHVVTNFHVIAGANLVYVQLHAGDPMSARVIGGAPRV